MVQMHTVNSKTNTSASILASELPDRTTTGTLSRRRGIELRLMLSEGKNARRNTGHTSLVRIATSMKG